MRIRLATIEEIKSRIGQLLELDKKKIVKVTIADSETCNNESFQKKMVEPIRNGKDKYPEWIIVGIMSRVIERLIFLVEDTVFGSKLNTMILFNLEILLSQLC